MKEWFENREQGGDEHARQDEVDDGHIDQTGAAQPDPPPGSPRPRPIAGPQAAAATQPADDQRVPGKGQAQQRGDERGRDGEEHPDHARHQT